MSEMARLLEYEEDWGSDEDLAALLANLKEAQAAGMTSYRLGIAGVIHLITELLLARTPEAK